MPAGAKLGLLVPQMGNYAPCQRMINIDDGGRTSIGREARQIEPDAAILGRIVAKMLANKVWIFRMLGDKRLMSGNILRLVRRTEGQMANVINEDILGQDIPQAGLGGTQAEIAFLPIAASKGVLVKQPGRRAGRHADKKTEAGADRHVADAASVADGG